MGYGLLPNNCGDTLITVNRLGRFKAQFNATTPPNEAKAWMVLYARILPCQAIWRGFLYKKTDKELRFMEEGSNNIKNTSSPHRSTGERKNPLH